jgi:hypothetical protein
MKKYHKDIGFLPCHVTQAKALIYIIKGWKMGCSRHALNELTKERNAEEIGAFLLNYTLDFNDVFEMAICGELVQKIGFRVNLGEKDVVFVVSREKILITVWTNNKNDSHYTLNTSNYCKA